MRKSIVIFGIIMSFILGSLVSAPSVTAASGTPFVFMQKEIDAINMLILELQEELKKVHVKWVNVDEKPPELLEMSCDPDQIGKWDGNKWVCAGPSGSTEFVIKLSGLTDVTEICTVTICNKKIIKEFKITGLPSSTKEYKIPINLIQLGADMGAISGSFEILLEESPDEMDENFSQFFFIGVGDTTPPIFRSIDHLQVSSGDHIIIEADKTEKFFRLIGRTFGTSPTGSFDNLKFVMSLPLPEGATIEFIPPI